MLTSSLDTTHYWWSWFISSLNTRHWWSFGHTDLRIPDYLSIVFEFECVLDIGVYSLNLSAFLLFRQYYGRCASRLRKTILVVLHFQEILRSSSFISKHYYTRHLIYPSPTILLSYASKRYCTRHPPHLSTTTPDTWVVLFAMVIVETANTLPLQVGNMKFRSINGGRKRLE